MQGEFIAIIHNHKLTDLNNFTFNIRERDSNQLQPEVDDDDNIPKEEITILSSHHNDEEVEHNFSNPIYDQVEKRGHIASDTTYSCCAYTEVRLSMVRVEENDDSDNSGHEAEL